MSPSATANLEPPAPPRLALLALLLGYLALAGAYNLSVPLFEAPDEHAHYFFAQHLAHEASLPVQPLDPDDRGPWEQEGSQPPLYYMLAAPIARLANAQLEHDELRYNHQNSMGNPSIVGNENRFVHGPVEALPWTGWVAAAHAMRGLSTLLGLVAVLAAYGVGRHALPGSGWLALAVAATVAFLPQFLATTAAVTNDALIIAIATASLWALIAVSKDSGNLPAIAVLVLTAGIAPLAKLSGLALTGFVVTALVVRALAPRLALNDPPSNVLLRASDDRSLQDASPSSGRYLRLAAVVAGAATLVCGWWYVRNLRLYGDLTGLSHMLPGDTRRDFHFWTWLASLQGEVVGLWRSTWGLFGWFTVMLPGWTYLVIDIVAAAGLVGFGVWLVAPRRPYPGRMWIWLLAWLALVGLSLLRWLTIAKGAHGRLLFPALVVMSLILVAGLRRIVPARLADRSFALLLATGMVGLSVFALTGTIRSAFAQPPATALDTSSAPEPPLVSFQPAGGAGGLHLHGVEHPATVTEGQSFEVVMLWAADAVNGDGFVALRLDQLPIVDGTLAPVSSPAYLAYPGNGSLPPDLMAPGNLYTDRRLLEAPELVTPRMPLALRLSVHLYDQARERRWETDPDLPGDEWSTELVLRPRPSDRLPAHDVAAPLASFATGIELLSANVDWGNRRLWAVWRATEDVAVDLTAFIHVRSEGAAIAYLDQPPATHGHLPTSMWSRGDVIAADYGLSLDDSSAQPDQLLLGLYDDSGTRIAATDAQGRAWPDAAVQVPIEP